MSSSNIRRFRRCSCWAARVLEEGGYETRGLYHGGIGYFAPSAQEVVVEHVRELARQAGRRSMSANQQ